LVRVYPGEKRLNLQSRCPGSSRFYLDFLERARCWFSHARKGVKHDRRNSQHVYYMEDVVVVVDGFIYSVKGVAQSGSPDVHPLRVYLSILAAFFFSLCKKKNPYPFFLSFIRSFFFSCPHFFFSSLRARLYVWVLSILECREREGEQLPVNNSSVRPGAVPDRLSRSMHRSFYSLCGCNSITSFSLSPMPFKC